MHPRKSRRCLLLPQLAPPSASDTRLSVSHCKPPLVRTERLTDTEGETQEVEEDLEVKSSSDLTHPGKIP
jgi:hypothetical protein